MDIYGTSPRICFQHLRFCFPNSLQPSPLPTSKVSILSVASPMDRALSAKVNSQNWENSANWTCSSFISFVPAEKKWGYRYSHGFLRMKHGREIQHLSMIYR